MNLICYKTGLDTTLCPCPDCRLHRNLSMIVQMPGGSTTPALPPPAPAAPPKSQPKDELLPDIEVGRHALRTFKIDYRLLRLKSLFQEHYWDGGTVVAECRKPHGGERCESSPSLACTCGIYGTLTIEHLLKEYGQYAHNCVAVFAAEGTTILGTKGLRTAAARIVAYWCNTQSPGDDISLMNDFWSFGISESSQPFWRNETNHYVDTFAKQCPEAQRFGSVDEMLEAYHFPKDTTDELLKQRRKEAERQYQQYERQRHFPSPPQGIYQQFTDDQLKKATEQLNDQMKKIKEQLGVDLKKGGFTTKGREAIDHILKFLT